MRCPHCRDKIRLAIKLDIDEMVDYVWTMLAAEGIASKTEAVEAAVDYALEYLRDVSYLEKRQHD